ncbi:MAG: insulinase family protein, partial [Gammaproteobacteria bacterium]|nr:insulinase family protein [Gammaproteobacteria bacterium]
MTAVQKSLLALVLVISTATASAEVMSLPPFERIRLDNGTTLLLNEKHDVPLIGLSAILRGGAVSDPEGLHGLSGLLARLLEKGAGDRDAAAFAEAVDSVGGRLSASGGLETITISGDFLASDADLMIELLADMLRRPALSPAEMQKLRDRSINFIRAAKDSNLDALLPIYGSSMLFADHPYGNPVSGSEESLAAISITDITSYYDNHVGGDRLVVSVSGDFDTETMKQKLSDAFGDWSAANAEIVAVNPATPVTGRQVLLVDKPGATQTYFWIGNVGVGIRYGHRAELDIANTVFGGRFTSMLNT